MGSSTCPDGRLPDDGTTAVHATMIQTINPRIERALEIVDRERSRVADERDAFSRFVDRLRRLESTDGPSTAGGPAPGRRVLARPEPARGLASRIETAYRETVMATPHYDEDYGDSFDHEISVELGPEAAHVITGTAPISPAQYRVVLRSAESSLRDRDGYLDELADERDSLRRIDDRLSEIESRLGSPGDDPIEERPYSRLIDDRERLLDLEAEADRLAARRQEEIQHRSVGMLSGVDESSLAAYLYGDCGATCPALSDVVSVLESVRSRRERIERELASRP